MIKRVCNTCETLLSVGDFDAEPHRAHWIVLAHFPEPVDDYPAGDFCSTTCLVAELHKHSPALVPDPAGLFIKP